MTDKKADKIDKVDMKKSYRTRSGRPVRILCVDRKMTDYPVIGLMDCGETDSLMGWSIDGQYRVNGCDLSMNLVEYNPLEDLKKDQVIWVTDGFGCWHPRHFAYVDEHGDIVCFADGRSSATADGNISTWGQFRLTKPE